MKKYCLLGLSFFYVVLPSVMLLSRTKTFRGKQNVSNTGLYHTEEAIGFFTSCSLLECLAFCMHNDRCVTFFFNNKSSECILHSNPFYYTQMSKSGDGWNFYVAKTGDERCTDTNNFYFYRHLDICYNFNGQHVRDYNQMEENCQNVGGSLLRVTSEELQRYITYILVDIDLVVRRPLCIQGSLTSTSSVWRFDDGTAMTFFNWGQGEPSGPGFIIMKRNDGYAWFVTANTTTKTCTYICQR